MASGPGSSMQKLRAERYCCSLSHLSLIDDFAVHEGDLARRPAKGEAADAGPDFGGFGESGRRAHGFALLVGQLWVSSVASRHQR